MEIFREGDEIIIQSRLPLRDLLPAKTRKTMVTIAGEEFYVADTRSSRDRRHFLYKLTPWVSGREIAGRRLFYESADDLATEAESRLKEKKTAFVRIFYTFVFPFIGFLPLSWKESLEERFGCSIHTHTLVSVCAEAVIAIGATTLLLISNLAATMLAVMFGGGPSGLTTLINQNLLLGAIAVCGTDAVFRYHHYSDGRYLGFYEWLFRRRND